MPSAVAAEGPRVSGFGTFGYVLDNRADIAPVRDISQYPDAQYKTGSTWQVDTRLGAQLEYGVAADVDLVGQLVFRDHFNSRLDSTTELAYLGVRRPFDVDLRVGRINYDAFLMSDHRNVGYAYTWVRPPMEFYGWAPIFSIDGADAAYSVQDGDHRWRFKLQAARSHFDIPIGSGYRFKANNLWAVSATRQSARWRMKAAYSQFTIASEVPAFSAAHAGLDAVAAAGIPQVSAEAADLRRNISFQGAKITYATLGAAYDDGEWFAQGEAGYTTATADVVPHGRMAYLSLGHRFGNWSPYVMAATSRPGNAVRSAQNDWGAVNATLRDPVLFIVNTTRIAQDTLTLGVRWDFDPRAAVKLQWDHTKISPSGYGLWWREATLNGQVSRINLLSATLDFIF